MLTAKLGFQPLLPSRCYRSFHHAVHRTTRSVRSLAIGVGDYFYTTKWSFIIWLKLDSNYQTQQCIIFKIRRRLTMIALVSGFIVAMLALRTGDDLDLPFKDIPVNKQPSFFFCWFYLFKKTTAVALSATFTTFGIIYQLTMPRHTILHCCC